MRQRGICTRPEPRSGTDLVQKEGYEGGREGKKEKGGGGMGGMWVGVRREAYEDLRMKERDVLDVAANI